LDGVASKNNPTTILLTKGKEMSHTEKQIMAIFATLALIINRHPNKKDIMKDLGKLKGSSATSDYDEILDLIREIPDESMFEE